MRKDVLIYFTGKLIPALVNLAIIILAVRFLGKAEYGKYSLVFYATMLLSTLTLGWIQQSILRFLSAYPDEQTLVINRFYFLALVSTMLAALVCAFLCMLYFHLGWADTLVVVVYTFMYNIFLFHLTLSQTRRLSFNYAAFESSYNLFYLAFFFLFTLALGMRLFNVLFIAMVAGLLMAALVRITLLPGGRAGIDLSRIWFDASFSKKVFGFGFPITFWLFLSYLINISDRFIIKEFTGYENVGTYAAVKDLIIKIATFTTIPILLAYHPMIVEKWNRGKKRDAMGLIREGLLYCMLIAVAAIIFFLFFSRMFYNRILHLEVESNDLVSAALLGSAFLWQAALLLHKPLELLLKPRLMLVAIIAALAVNTAANVIFVPHFGYPASAVISFFSVLTYILVILAYLLRFSRKGYFRASV